MKVCQITSTTSIQEEVSIDEITNIEPQPNIMEEMKGKEIFIYTFGGRLRGRTLNTVERFNFKTMTWEVLSSSCIAEFIVIYIIYIYIYSSSLKKYFYYFYINI